MRSFGTLKVVVSALALGTWLFLLRGVPPGVVVTGAATVASFLALGLWRPRLTLGLLVAFAASTHILSAIEGVPWFSPAEGGLLALWVAVSWRDRAAPRRPLDLAGFFCLLFGLYALLSAIALVFRFQYPSLATGFSFLIHPWGDLLRLSMASPLYGFRGATLLLEGMLAFALARRLDSEPGEGKATLWGLWSGGCLAVLSYFVFYLPRLLEPWKNWQTYRPALTLHDANSAASFGLLVLGAGIALASRGVKGKWVYLLPGLAILFLGGSRIAFFIALVGCAGLTAFLWAVRAKRNPSEQDSALLPSLGPALLATVLLAGMLGFLAVKQARFQDLLSGEAFTTGHLAGRQGFIDAAVKMISQYPISGVGGGTYTSSVHQFLEKGGAPVHSQIENAHSYPLQLAADYGLPALFLWLALLWVVLAPRLRQWRALSPEAAGLLAGLLFYLLHCLQSHPLLLPEHQVLFWAALGGLAGHFNRIAEAAGPSRLRWLAPLLLLAPLWSMTQAAPAAPQAQHFGIYASGSDPGGEQMRWSAPQAWLVLPAGVGSKFRIALQRPGLAESPVTLRLEADGITVFEGIYRDPTFLGAAFLPPADGGGALLHLAVAPPFIPSEQGLSQDRRRLGVLVSRTAEWGEPFEPPGGSWKQTPGGLAFAVAPIEASALPVSARRLACIPGESPAQVAPGATFPFTVTFRNDSSLRWPGDELATTQKPLCASYHWKRLDGTIALWDGPRTVLKASLAPGAEWKGTLAITAPREPGTYLLEVDLLQETVAWFGCVHDVRAVDVVEGGAAPSP